MISISTSDNMCPKIKFLNKIIPIPMHLCSFVSKLERCILILELSLVVAHG